MNQNVKVSKVSKVRTQNSSLIEPTKTAKKILKEELIIKIQKYQMNKILLQLS